MKAYLRSAPLAPKKANIIAKMVRGMTVKDALHSLARTHKKGARMIEKLLNSAVANAEHNEKQKGDDLIIKSIIVNQSLGYRRGVPKARGQMRPMTKFLSHISVTLGVAGDTLVKHNKIPSKAAKTGKASSQAAKNTVKTSAPKKKQASSSPSTEASAKVDASSNS